MTSRKPTYDVAFKVAGLLRVLEKGTYFGEAPVNALAETLEVSRRTVIRYANALAAGVSFSQGRYQVELPAVGRFHRKGEAWLRLLDRDSSLSASIFQFATVHAGMKMIDAGGGSLLGVTAGDFLGQLEGRLGPADSTRADRVRTAFHYVPFGPKRYNLKQDVLDHVLQALLRRHPLDVDYRDRRGNAFQTRLEPFTLVLYRDGLYVLGRAINRKGIQAWSLFAIDRIARSEMDDGETFDVPADFDPADHFESTLGLWPTDELAREVELAFSPQVAVDIRERTWPGDHELDLREDGWTVLRMSVQVTPEVVAWILSWGPSVEVLAPRSLRREVASRLRVAIGHYQDIGYGPGVGRSSG